MRFREKNVLLVDNFLVLDDIESKIMVSLIWNVLFVIKKNKVLVICIIFG